MKTIFTLVFALSAFGASAQELAGRILNEKKEPAVNATIRVFQYGILKGNTTTDYDGNYTVKPLDPGYYDVTAFFRDYDSVMVTSVVAIPNQKTTQNVLLSKSNGIAKCVKMTYKKTLINDEEPVHLVNSGDIRQIPGTQVTDLTRTPSYQYYGGHGFNPNFPIGGPRASETQYIIDGVVIQQPKPVTIPQKPLIDLCNPTTHILTRAEIDQMPYTSINDLIALFPGVYQSRRGDNISIYGSRTNGTNYIIDGPGLYQSTRGNDISIYGSRTNGANNIIDGMQ